MKLAVDASSLVAESLRARGEQLITHRDLTLYISVPTWSDVEHEIGRRLDAMLRRGRIGPSARGPMFEGAMAMLAENLTIVSEEEHGQHEAEARDRIPRDPKDWPTVALALKLGIGIWAVDDDFFGCGVPVWTTQTLLPHLAAGRARLSD